MNLKSQEAVSLFAQRLDFCDGLPVLGPTRRPFHPDQSRQIETATGYSKNADLHRLRKDVAIGPAAGDFAQESQAPEGSSQGEIETMTERVNFPSEGQSGRRTSTVVDLDRATVERMAGERTQASLDGYFQGLTPAQREGLAAIAMDMWPAYIQAALAHVPDAADKIGFDRYHLMTHIGKAVDTVRKQEHRALQQTGDVTLIGSMYRWLDAGENLPAVHHERVEALQARSLKAGRAWALKETLRGLCRYTGAAGPSASGGAGTSGPRTPSSRP